MPDNTNSPASPRRSTMLSTGLQIDANFLASGGTTIAPAVAYNDAVGNASLTQPDDAIADFGNELRFKSLSDMGSQLYSFSGADIRVQFVMPSMLRYDLIGLEARVVKEVKNLQTLSVSVFREKMPVRSLGFIAEKGRTRGTRTVAGSLVFTVFDRHPLHDLLAPLPWDKERDIVKSRYALADQLPPFDIIITYANEAGLTADMVIYAVDLSSEGQVHSIEDLITENTMQFTAGHMAIMAPGGWATNNGPALRSHGNTFSSIISSSTDQNITNMLALANKQGR